VVSRFQSNLSKSLFVGMAFNADAGKRLVHIINLDQPSYTVENRSSVQLGPIIRAKTAQVTS